MPREDRRIYFDHDEVYKAVYTLCMQKGVEKPPAGKIVHIQPNAENPLELDVVIENISTNLSKVYNYSQDFMIAALMIMCRSTGIPLPKGANKGMEIDKGKVILRVQMLR